MTFTEDAARVAAVVDGATCTVTLFAQSNRLRVFFKSLKNVLKPGPPVRDRPARAAAGHVPQTSSPAASRLQNRAAWSLTSDLLPASILSQVA